MHFVFVQFQLYDKTVGNSLCMDEVRNTADCLWQSVLVFNNTSSERQEPQYIRTLKTEGVCGSEDRWTDIEHLRQIMVQNKKNQTNETCKGNAFSSLHASIIILKGLVCLKWTKAYKYDVSSDVWKSVYPNGHMKFGQNASCHTLLQAASHSLHELSSRTLSFPRTLSFRVFVGSIQ